METELLPGERIDDLQRNGYRIIQNRNGFCFGMDAVLLSGFVSAKPQDRIIDLGTGTGIIPLLLNAKTGSKDITGIEIQEESAEMAQRSVRLNDLEEEVHILKGDIRHVTEMFPAKSFDIVVSNPPYMKNSGGLQNPEEAKAIARHEILCNFEDVVKAASGLLKVGGKFFLVHRPERLAELIDTLREYRLEPKRIRMVHSFINEKAVMVLIEAASGGGTFLKVEPPLIIYKEKNVYHDEIYNIYGF